MGPDPLLGVIYHWIGGLASASNFIPFRRSNAGRGKFTGSFKASLRGSSLRWCSHLCSSRICGRFSMRPAHQHHLWPLCLGSSVGHRWPHLRLVDSLPRNRPWIRHCAGLLHRIRHSHASYLQRPDHSYPHQTGGQIILAGVAVCMAAIAVNGLAGYSKEKEVPAKTSGGRRARLLLRQGSGRRHLRRHHELLFRVWTCGRQTHRGNCTGRAACAAVQTFGRTFPSWLWCSGVDSSPTLSGHSFSSSRTVPGPNFSERRA